MIAPDKKKPGVWQKVSDTPEGHIPEECIVSFKDDDGKSVVTSAHYEKAKFFHDNGWQYPPGRVTHWQPYPDPPQEA